MSTTLRKINGSKRKFATCRVFCGELSRTLCARWFFRGRPKISDRREYDFETALIGHDKVQIHARGSINSSRLSLSLSHSLFLALSSFSPRERRINYFNKTRAITRNVGSPSSNPINRITYPAAFQLKFRKKYFATLMLVRTARDSSLMQFSHREYALPPIARSLTLFFFFLFSITVVVVSFLPLERIINEHCVYLEVYPVADWKCTSILMYRGGKKIGWRKVCSVPFFFFCFIISRLQSSMAISVRRVHAIYYVFQII